MMLGVSGLKGSSGDGAAGTDAHESGGASGGSSEVGASSSIPGGGGGLDESERSGGGGGGGGNRWPRQETLALLKIRSDMDVTFRDSSLKGPLWEEVSRKMAELGFQRTAKKCKEKFENVFKYHKRTKDGRSSKSDGKTYRFFDQLEAFESAPPQPFTSPAQPRTTAPIAAPPPPPPAATNTVPMPPVNVTVSSISPNPISEVRPNINPIINSSSYNHPAQDHLHQTQFPTLNTAASNPHMLSTSFLYSTSSSTSSDEDIQRRRGKKRKWKDFFQRLMKDVVHKQEELQKKFLDTLERRERDRMVREEARRAEEIGRLNREHELLVQERSIAAAKDAAVIAFLQKVTDQQNLQIPNIGNITAAPPPPPPPPTVQAAMQVQLPPANPLPQPPQPSSNINPLPPPPPPRPILATPVAAATPMKTVDNSKADNGGGGSGDNSMYGGGSSRWPKAEVQELINLRTSLDIKYQENGPKGPLWEEISSAMAQKGYNRSAKRCKEKWENINKYFKKVKESNKKRPEDSKTCPYFHQLDAIYKERAKNDPVSFRPENNPMVPIMARPEQQWPLAAPEQQPPHDPAMPADHHHDNESDNNDHEEDEDGDDEDEEDEGEGYEIVANKQPSDAAE